MVAGGGRSLQAGPTTRKASTLEIAIGTIAVAAVVLVAVIRFLVRAVIIPEPETGRSPWRAGAPWWSGPASIR